MNHTETIYQITKLTQEALSEVEKGCDPYWQYQCIKDAIDGNEKFSAMKKFRKDIKQYFTILVAVMLFICTCFYGFRGLGIMIMTERFWPAFWYVILAGFFGSTMGFILSRED